MFMRSMLLPATAALLLSAGGALAQSVDRPGHESPKPGTNSETMSAMKDSTAGMVGKGARYVVVGSDLALLRSACVATARAAREAVRA